MTGPGPGVVEAAAMLVHARRHPAGYGHVCGPCRILAAGLLVGGDMSGCRDCQTCTAPGAARAQRSTLAGLMHLCTAGLSWVATRAFMSRCPQCSHLMGRHQRRADGSFRD